MMTTEHSATSNFAQALLTLPWVWHQERQSRMQRLECRAFATLVSFCHFATLVDLSGLEESDEAPERMYDCLSIPQIQGHVVSQCLLVGGK
jgi:hypothetical protein